MFFPFMYGQNCYCYVKPAYKKDDFVRAGTQTSYVGDEAVKSRERAAIHSACRSLVCLCKYTKPPATQAMLRHIMCTVPATNRDARCWGYTLIKRYGKTSDKNGQLMFCNIAAKRVETRCCAFYNLQFKPVLLQIRLLQVAWILRLLFRSLQEPDLFSEGRFDSWVVKRATSLFNSFFSNVAKQVEGFCCPFIP